MVFERERYLKLSHTRNRGERSYKKVNFHAFIGGWDLAYEMRGGN
jgi:hypothetical protein